MRRIGYATDNGVFYVVSDHPSTRLRTSSALDQRAGQPRRHGEEPELLLSGSLS